MEKKLYSHMNWPKIEAIIYSEDDNPHLVLGKSTCMGGTLFQTFQPQALRVFVSYNEERKQVEMLKVEKEGYFAIMVPERSVMEYIYLIENEDGTIKKMKDPYQFQPIIDAGTIEGIERGMDYEIYQTLGAHEKVIHNTPGVLFSAWAPNALRVSVVGDFNHWDGRRNPMRRLYQSGVFELFIPDVKMGDVYKFEIKLNNSLTYLKADPYAFEMQTAPFFASIVSSINNNYLWTDKNWLQSRKTINYDNKCMNILELNFAFFKKESGYYTYHEMASPIIEYVKKMHYTHIEIMPIMEYFEEECFGYKTTNFYAPTSRFGKPEGLKYFVDLCHSENIGVIFDWIPGEFSKENHGLIGFDGTGLYEHQNDLQGENYKNNTKKFNLGRNEVTNFLIANALYWIEKFHADGLCLHGVGEMLYLDYGKKEGEWIPNIYDGNENLDAIKFLKDLNCIVKKRNKGVFTIAEDSTKWPMVTAAIKDGGLGFDFKWNVAWTYDMLGYFAKDPMFRSNVYNEFMVSMVYAYSERYMIGFTHHEMVNAKASLFERMYGNPKEKYANMRAMYSYMFFHPGKKMMFLDHNPITLQSWNVNKNAYMQEFNEEIMQFYTFMEEIHNFYQKEPALFQYDYQTKGFQWVNSICQKDCIYSFVRKGKETKEILFIICNFENKEVIKKDVGVPFYGKYKEVFNSSLIKYGGELEKTARKKNAQTKDADGMQYSIKVHLEPLSVSVYKVEMDKLKNK